MADDDICYSDQFTEADEDLPDYRTADSRSALSHGLTASNGGGTIGCRNPEYPVYDHKGLWDEFYLRRQSAEYYLSRYIECRERVDTRDSKKAASPSYDVRGTLPPRLCSDPALSSQ